MTGLAGFGVACFGFVVVKQRLDEYLNMCQRCIFFTLVFFFFCYYFFYYYYFVGTFIYSFNHFYFSFSLSYF